MKLLLVEDNIALAESLARLLRRDNYTVDCLHRGDEAETALADGDYALVILDLALPQIDGLTLLKGFRRRNTTTPVIILTANDALTSRIAGLDHGADDYLIKPFEVSELEARIRAQLRRVKPSIAMTLSCGPLVFDTGSRAFRLADHPLALTPREHGVLAALIQRVGKPMSKTSLAESVFGFDDETNPNAIEIYVHRVRRKLEASGAVITTLRGLGYMLSAAPASAALTSAAPASAAYE